MSLILKLRGCANFKELTGELFVTSFGEILVYNEQDKLLSIDDIILYDGSEREIQNILPPSTPDGKWAVELKKP